MRDGADMPCLAWVEKKLNGFTSQDVLIWWHRAEGSVHCQQMACEVQMTFKKVILLTWLVMESTIHATPCFLRFYIFFPFFSLGLLNGITFLSMITPFITFSYYPYLYYCFFALNLTFHLPLPYFSICLTLPSDGMAMKIAPRFFLHIPDLSTTTVSPSTFVVKILWKSYQWILLTIGDMKRVSQ